MKELPGQPQENDVTQNHIEALMAKPESVDALDMSSLFVQLGYFEFQDVFKQLIKAYKEKTGKDLSVEFIFAINDPDIEKIWPDKQMFLKNLKGFRENRKFRKHIEKITVKGPAGTPDLEPNVFASGVQFELME